MPPRVRQIFAAVIWSAGLVSVACAGEPLRLQGDIPSQIYAAAKSKDLEEESAILKSATLLFEKWIKCVHEATGRLTQSSAEPAETIVTAAFGNCANIERSFYLQLLRTKFMTVSATDEMKVKIRATKREHLIAQVLASRARSK